jgi:hypothetical protein
MAYYSITVIERSGAWLTQTPNAALSHFCAYRYPGRKPISQSPHANCMNSENHPEAQHSHRVELWAAGKLGEPLIFALHMSITGSHETVASQP